MNLLERQTKLSHLVKREDGWHVMSDHKKDGHYKHLGGPYDSKTKALKRLRQVEYFKHHGS